GERQGGAGNREPARQDRRAAPEAMGRSAGAAAGAARALAADVRGRAGGRGRAVGERTPRRAVAPCPPSRAAALVRGGARTRTPRLLPREPRPVRYATWGTSAQ